MTASPAPETAGIKKIYAIVIGAIGCIASGVLSHFGIITAEQSSSIFNIVGGAILGLLGVQQFNVSSLLKDVQQRQINKGL